MKGNAAAKSGRARRGPWATLIAAGFTAAALAAVAVIRGGPQSAAAGMAGLSVRQNSTQKETARGVLGALGPTEVAVERLNSFPRIAQLPLERLRANPFRSGNVSAGGSDAPTDPSALRREADRVAALNAVQGLQLQSIIHGDTRACMINNTLYQEGQDLDIFTIEKINATGVIIRNGAYRFELRIQH